MILFRSLDIECVDFAIKNSVWQCHFNPKKVKIGDMVAIQVTQTRFICVLGKVISEPHFSKRLPWPTNHRNEPEDSMLYTIDIEPVPLRGPWRYTEI